MINWKPISVTPPEEKIQGCLIEYLFHSKHAELDFYHVGYFYPEDRTKIMIDGKLYDKKRFTHYLELTPPN